MRGLKLARWLGLGLCLAVFGCKDKGAAETGKAPITAGELEGSEKDLLARRDSLLSARSKIRKERGDLVAQRIEILEKGGDTTEIDRRTTELLVEENKLSEEEDALNDSLTALLNDRRRLVQELSAQASSQNQAAARDVLMASREKDLARREERLAERESSVATREALLAKREKETCGVATQTIIQTVDSKGSKYTKADVAPMLERARKDMSRKGILRSDLPAAAQDLEDEATEAMAKGDYGRAHFAANQLVRSVRGINIDKAFIAAKIGRLNQAIKGKKLSGAQDQEVSNLFREATSNFGDGRFTGANKRLNKIYTLIR